MRTLIVCVLSSIEEVESALDESSEVKNWSLLGDGTEGRFYRIELVTSFSLYEAIIGLDMAPILTEVVSTGWLKRGRFPTREALADFCSAAEAVEVEYHLERLTEGAVDNSVYGLTERQQVALQTAYNSGYFDTPRQTSTRDLGAKLNISATSASELLRRGQRQLLEQTVLTNIYGVTGEGRAELHK